jgi:hypothetical protein
MSIKEKRADLKKVVDIRDAKSLEVSRYVAGWERHGMCQMSGYV